MKAIEIFLKDNEITVKAESLYKALEVTKYSFDEWTDIILSYNFYLKQDYFYIDSIKSLVFSLDMVKTICIIHKSDQAEDLLKFIKYIIDNPSKVIPNKLKEDIEKNKTEKVFKDIKIDKEKMNETLKTLLDCILKKYNNILEEQTKEEQIKPL